MEIKRLTPELCNDWVKFFDEVAFQDHNDWRFCYCLEGFLTHEEQTKWTDCNERRQKAIDLIQSGIMQGYLVYENDEVVGWCNTNDRNNYRFVNDVYQAFNYHSDLPETEKVRVIFCFLIAKEHRNKGVARKLYERIYQDSILEGYHYLEAYPFSDQSLDFQFHGSRHMYEEKGFEEVGDLQYMKIMRKKI